MGAAFSGTRLQHHLSRPPKFSVFCRNANRADERHPMPANARSTPLCPASSGFIRRGPPSATSNVFTHRP